MTSALYENGCAEVKYNVRFETGSSNMVETVQVSGSGLMADVVSFSEK